MTLEIDNDVLDGVVAIPYDYPYVSNIIRKDANPNSASLVNFTVTFSKTVTGVNAADFRLTTTGVTNASISTISGSGTTYNVAVNTGQGSGTIRLDVVDNDSIKDAANNSLGGASTGNGNFNSGEMYTITRSVNISGNAGSASVTLSYMDGTLKTVVSDSSGNYSLTVPAGWSGTVKPVRVCYTFTPGNRVYSNVLADQTGQNYSATFQGIGCGAAVGKYDDTDSHWVYLGTWQTFSGSGPYNNNLHYTVTMGDTASFPFNGTQFVFSYTRYPNRGSFDIYVDGSKITTINANGTVGWQTTYTSPTFAAGLHIVQFRNIGGSGPVMDVDAIQVLNTMVPGVGKYDDNDANWSYTGTWLSYSGSGPYNNTLRYTVTLGDSVSFPFNGTQFVLSYTQYPNRGSFEVYVDGTKVATVNANGTAQWQKTFTSPILSAGTHVAQFKNIGGSGPVMDVDAIEILNPVIAIPGSGKYDDGTASWVYEGTWLTFNGAGPYNNTLHYTTAVGNWAWFTFSGTQFLLSYTQYPNRGSFDVYVDGGKITTVNANGTVVWQKTYTSPIFSTGTHVVQFKNIGGSGSIIDVDAIQVLP